MASLSGITPIDDGSTIRLNFGPHRGAPRSWQRKLLLGEEGQGGCAQCPPRQAADKAKAMKKAGELTEDT